MRNITAEDLIFKGGGPKGIAYLGALAAMDAAGVSLNSIKRVGGTSAGAITALGVALGCNIEELKAITLDADFESFLDGEGGSVRNQMLFNARDAQGSKASAHKTRLGSKAAKQIYRSYGMFRGEKIRKWIETLVANKTGIKHCTFRELKQLTEEAGTGFKELAVISMNLNEKRAIKLSAETTPDVIISDAVRCSLSIPFIYDPWQPYTKVMGARVRPGNDDLWVDGGVAMNYPIGIFDTKDPESGKSIHNPNTLGFYVADPHHFDEEPCRNNIDGLFSYITHVIGSLHTAEYHSQHREGLDDNQTIYINAGDVDLLNFNLTPDQQVSLITSGWNAACEYLGVERDIPDELINLPEPTSPSADEASSSSSTGSSGPSCRMM